MSRRLADRYELIEPLGAGGMGEVWRALDRQLGREVAVKVLPEGLAADPRRRDRFEREARAAARLHHPNILEVYDSGVDEGRQFVVMERLEGADLGRRMVRGPVPWHEATDIALQVVRGLDAAHRHGVVHRDLKPANLFLCRDGRVKILDFGLARLSQDDDSGGDDGVHAPTLTDSGTVMGTAGYMSPEQVRGQPADARSDLFSFGCVLHEMLSGKRPFGGGSSAEVMTAILRDEPEPIARPIPRSLRQLVDRCLRKEPGQRFGSAAEVVAALEVIRDSDEVELDAGPVPSGSKMPVRAAAWAAGVGLAGLVVAWGLIAWQQSSRATGPTSELEPRRIAVLPFTNRSGDPGIDPLGQRIADRIVAELASLEELEVAHVGVVAAEAGARPPLSADRRSTVSAVSRTTSSGLVLTGVIYAERGGVEFQGTLEDAISGRVVRAFGPVLADTGELAAAIDRLAGQVLVATSDHLHLSLAFGAGDVSPDPATYLAFRDGIRNLDWGRWQDLQRLLERDPGFDRLRLTSVNAAANAPFYSLARQVLSPMLSPEARLNRHQNVVVGALQAWLDGRWDQAYRNFRDELALEPRSVRLRFDALRCALRANRPAETIELFREYSRDDAMPASMHILVITDTAEAHHALGQYREQLALLERLRSELPSSTVAAWSLRLHATALAALGDVDGVERRLRESLGETDPQSRRAARFIASRELRAHGFPEASARVLAPLLDELAELQTGPEDAAAASQHASALLLAGRVQEAFDLAIRLAEAGRGWQALQLAAVAAARLGDRSSARRLAAELAEIDEDALPDGAYHLGDVTLARAAIAAHLGERQSAFRLLRAAIDEGTFVYELHRNPFLEPLWDDPEFRELLRPKG